MLSLFISARAYTAAINAIFVVAAVFPIPSTRQRRSYDACVECKSEGNLRAVLSTTAVCHDTHTNVVGVWILAAEH